VFTKKKESRKRGDAHKKQVSATIIQTFVIRGRFFTERSVKYANRRFLTANTITVWW
jgi:hypothetical protein